MTKTVAFSSTFPTISAAQRDALNQAQAQLLALDVLGSEVSLQTIVMARRGFTQGRGPNEGSYSTIPWYDGLSQ